LQKQHGRDEPIDTIHDEAESRQLLFFGFAHMQWQTPIILVKPAAGKMIPPRGSLFPNRAGRWQKFPCAGVTGVHVSDLIMVPGCNPEVVGASVMIVAQICGRQDKKHSG